MIVWTSLLVSLSGCQTSIRFLYNQSDWLVERWANQLLEFRGDRRAELHREVQGFFKEHQKTERPLIAYYLRSTADLISRGDPTEAKIQGSLNDFENLAQRTLVLGAPGASRILASLSAAETESLIRNIERKNSHHRAERENLSLEDWRKQRRKNFIKAVRFLVGSPSREQVALIQRWADESNYSKRSFWFEYRQSQQEGLIQMLSRKSSPSDIEKFIENWIYNRNRTPHSDYAKYLRTERQRLIKIILDLSLSLSPKQKEHFVETLQELSNSLSGS